MGSHEGDAGALTRGGTKDGAWGAGRMITAVLGVLMAVSGSSHGIFEILQGGARTPGILIQAMLGLCWSLLLASMILMHLSHISGRAERLAV